MIFYRLISYLPFWMLYGLASLGYILLYYVFRYRREVVTQNLTRAFPERNTAEIASLAKAFYRQLTDVTLEIIKAQRMSHDDFRDRVKLTNSELLQQYSNDFQDSVIVLTIHQGNWEWMLHGATTALGIPIDPVYKPLHNKGVDKLIYDIRSQFGSRPLSMEQATRDILRRRREFRLFVMVADQSPIRSERGYWSQFMNQEANFYLGTEIIAQMTKFPVLFAQCSRRKRGYYEITFHELARPPYEKGSHEIVDRYIALAEQSIRSEPESWLWSNRRWKRDRAAEEARESAD